MAKLLVVLTHDKIQSEIPYSVVCMARYGAVWNTGRRRRRWAAEFTEAEREAARKLFSQSHDWLLSRGVPDEVRMWPSTFALWQKLGAFCASL